MEAVGWPAGLLVLLFLLLSWWFVSVLLLCFVVRDMSGGGGASSTTTSSYVCVFILFLFRIFTVSYLLFCNKWKTTVALVATLQVGCLGVHCCAAPGDLLKCLTSH